MASQLDLDKAYLRMCVEWAKLSYARRRKVGCLIVKNHQIISDGYNGTPKGFDNNCEDEIQGKLVTKPIVLHAESNAISKLARNHNSGANADIFITHSPCLECAKLIYQSGISRVHYGQDYRDSSGIDFLLRSGIPVKKIGEINSPID